LATAYLDGGEVCRQTDTGKLGLIRFYAPLDIGLVVLTSSSPSRGRNSFGEKRCFWKPKWQGRVWHGQPASVHLMVHSCKYYIKPTREPICT